MHPLFGCKRELTPSLVIFNILMTDAVMFSAYAACEGHRIFLAVFFSENNRPKQKNHTQCDQRHENNCPHTLHLPLKYQVRNLSQLLDDSGSAAFGLTLDEILNGIPYIRIFKNETVF